MEMSHLSSRSFLPLQHCSHGRRWWFSSFLIGGNNKVVVARCLQQCEAMVAFRDALSGLTPLGGGTVAIQCHCPPPSRRGICGFVLHLRRGKKKKEKGFSGRVRTKALQAPCPVSNSHQYGPEPRGWAGL